MSEPTPSAIFVYGTLQRGEERECCWPKAPLSIRPGNILGELYDLGPYPGLVIGHDRIAGELWELADDDMAITLLELDQVECFGQGGVDLYERRIVNCLLADGTTLAAFTYFLADESFAKQQRRVTTDRDGYCRWHRFRK